MQMTVDRLAQVGLAKGEVQHSDFVNSHTLVQLPVSCMNCVLVGFRPIIGSL